ncbi:tripartite tricarboxylate transporter substrate binding protein [Ottowia caeni]|uniref:Bug family tripartite tricarboxylate transporter substrate binding protein n=1 Tax=Ottowia caeni TaxID=2870339 RepID=UPI001E2F88FC|nr:tripartite tricarboxylate transporter substrate binding protein [Ottowia caeni]
MTRAFRATSVFIATTLLCLGGAQAQTPNFPTKPVKIVTPFSAGSGPDAAMRALGDLLSRKWGQPVIIDNKPGGNGFVATAPFKQAQPDGHELIGLDSSHITTHPHTFNKLPYNAQKDFEPIRPILLTDFYVVVAKDSPFNSLADIVAAAKAKPGHLTYGSWFVGSPGHLGALRLESQTKIKMTHVPYKEMSQLYAGVSNKEVDWALGSAASAGPMEKAGKLKFIGLGASKRSSIYPDAPSTDESPVTKGFESSAWVGLFAPPGTPKAVKEKISADMREALATPMMQDRYRTLGYELMDLGPEQFAERIRKDGSIWKTVIQEAGLKLD